MDIIKFNNPNAPTRMEDARIVNGLTSKMWIERYRDAGEFTLVAPTSTGIREQLPIGSFISHVNTKEIMIVENHEINDNINSISEITITGRGFETFFENRIVGSNKAFPISGKIEDYIIPPDYTWNQATTLINNHISAIALIDDNNALPFVTVISSVEGTSTSIARSTSRDTLYAVLLSILEIENLGIKIIRPGPWSPLGVGSPDTAVVIHNGINRTQEVIYSYDTGEVISADYLWSNKNLKNAILVTSKWVEMVVTSTEVEYERRMMYGTAADIDDAFEVEPTGSDLTEIAALMTQRGREALTSYNNLALTKAELSKASNKAIFRKDFDVGDVITVNGDYNESSYMRVSEYVEIEDSNGESGYPTLTLD